VACVLPLYRPRDAEHTVLHAAKGGVMGKAVNCECGELVQASTDQEVIERVQAHVTVKHPALVGKLTVADILAMAEEV
jgi:hypothetical protein